MKLLRNLLLLLVPLVAFGAAPTANLAWTAPTQHTDGSAITGTLTYNIYQGASAAEVQVLTGITGTTLVVTTGLTPGAKVCWQVTAVEGGQESGRSTEGCKTFPFLVPNAPTSLSVT